MRSRAAARWSSWAAIAAVLGFVIWTRAVAGGKFGLPVPALAVLAVLGTAWLAHSDQDGWSFAGSAVTMGACLVSIFAALFPNVMVSSTNAAYNLTVSNAASGSYALKVMTVTAVIFVPLVLLYQGWSFHVFRGRLSTSSADPAATTPPAGASPPPAGPATATPGS